MPSTVAPGSKLGPYALLSPLGAGGMGVVYRARDERLERDVAVKVISPGLLTHEAARRRFRTEALALAKLNHPHIAAVYDVGEQDGTDYLVMEYVAGESLAQKLASGPLPAAAALSLGVEIASALEEAHEHGVVHRDLKPGNVIVTPKGRVKVLDFGLAKLRAAADAEGVTHSYAETAGAVGTPLYMSPEQAEGGSVDSRSDLWSLGAVLYETLTGRPPFQGDSLLSVLRSITQQPPTPLRSLRADAPEDVDRIVRRALEKDVARRYQSATELSRDLSAALVRLSEPGAPRRSGGIGVSRSVGVAAALLAVVLASVAGWLYRRSERRHWAREEAIPTIARLKADDRPLAAFLLLREAERYLPADPQLARIAGQDTRLVSVTSSPPGASVAIQDYLDADGSWFSLGTTPLDHVRIPAGYFRWKLRRKDGRESVTAPRTQAQMAFALDAQLAAPPGMSRVEAHPSWGDMIDFVGWIGPYDVPAYYLDRLEVSNRQYQEFVDQGGYRRRELWKRPFVRDGRELSWDEAMALLRDRTGRPGPSTWEGGHYPVGQGDYPVAGVSWYEASAYAAYAGNSLPTLPQWSIAAPSGVASYTVRASNISRSGLAPVGAYKGLGPYGTYDMAGNVREWVENATGDGLHFILGGSWDSQSYLYVDPEALPGFDRSPANGFRCVRNTAPLAADVGGPIRSRQRDLSRVKPASEEVFQAYRTMYTYADTPLEPKVESVVADTADWREEKTSFRTAYGDERMAAYLFLPRKVPPPFQAVVFFPSARVLDLTDSGALGDTKFFDYVVQSGRAVLYPVYHGTYERRSRLALPDGSQRLEYFTHRASDVGRALDYLQTRPDVDKARLAYLGVSMGAAEGIIYAALQQDRLKTVVLLDGGFFLGPPAAGADQADFAPRLTRPVLMVNGRYDYTFSLEKAQAPLFRMLGAPAADKRHVVLDGPHDVTQRRGELVHEVLSWLDRYLGRVE
jgi:dienelactone hydrolase/predicted Ser/Thr protein kinase